MKLGGEDRNELIAGIAQVAALFWPGAGVAVNALVPIVLRLMEAAEQTGKPGSEKRQMVEGRITQMAEAAGASPSETAEVRAEAGGIVERTVNRRKAAAALSKLLDARLDLDRDGDEWVQISTTLKRRDVELARDVLAELEW